MKIVYADINRLNVQTAFNRQAGSFDELFSTNAIINYKRRRVREHLIKYITPESSILELNSGTGEDAIYLARMGHSVHATDISEGMQQCLQRKVSERGLDNLITTELRSFTELSELQNKGPYDHIFSNFGGLNCTRDLDKVLRSLPGLLKPNGLITLVIINRFCLWETLLIFKGMFKTASRRWLNFNGTRAHIEGTYFNCWYYSPSYILKHTKHSFEILGIEGLCTLMPPSYIDNFAERYPSFYKYLEISEDRSKHKFPWKYLGDYFIISMRKKDVT